MKPIFYLLFISVFLISCSKVITEEVNPNIQEFSGKLRRIHYYFAEYGGTIIDSSKSELDSVFTRFQIATMPNREKFVQFYDTLGYPVIDTVIPLINNEATYNKHYNGLRSGAGKEFEFELIGDTLETAIYKWRYSVEPGTPTIKNRDTITGILTLQ